MSEITGCGSHSCFIAPPKKGMGHNGPCRCVDHRGLRYINQLRARLTDTERQLREAQERCERLEGLLKVAECPNRCDNGVIQYDEDEVGPCEWCDVRRAALSEPDEMTHVMQEGKV